MKEIFDRNRDHLNDREDRRVWAALHDAVVRRRVGWRRWRVPGAALATAAVAVVAVTLVHRGPAEHAGSDALLRQARPEMQSLKSAAPGSAADRDGLGAAEGLSAAAPRSEASPGTAASTEGTAASGRAASPGGAVSGSPGAAGASETGAGVSPGKPAARIQAFAPPAGTPPDEGAAGRSAPAKPLLHRLADNGVPPPPSLTAAKDAAEPAPSLSAQVKERARGEAKRLRPPDTPIARVDGAGAGSPAKDMSVEVPRRDGGPSPGMTAVPYISGSSGDENRRWPISVGGNAPVNGEAFDSMFFRHYGVNPFVDPEDDRLATFAVDVDNASYAMTRSYLERGELPPAASVRVEEFVNSFKHHYAPPEVSDVADRDGSAQRDAFAVHLEAAPSPFGEGLTLLRVGLKGREVSAENRKPANLTFVIDVSGSMAREDRLELVKRALYLLLDQMDRGDRVGIVVFGSNARTVLPPTSLRDRREIERAIASLAPEGATNTEEGLRVGYAMAGRAFARGAINRVVLCSDGVANVGNTGAGTILPEIKAEARKGIELTTVGFGMGNYNDVLMEKLADQGDGNYYYVDRLDEARRVFVENLTGTLQTIARQVKIQVEFDPGTVRRYRLLGYENRDVADRDFRNDKVDAGEVGAGHEVTALFEVKLEKEPRTATLATVRVRYEDPGSGEVHEVERAMGLRDVERSLRDADPTFRMDAAAAEFAEILRHSYWAKDSSLDPVAALAKSAARELSGQDDVQELVELVQDAERLWPSGKPAEWRDDVRPKWDPDDDYPQIHR